MKEKFYSNSGQILVGFPGGVMEFGESLEETAVESYMKD